MKRELGKRLGSLLLCIVLLFGSVSTEVYAMTTSENERKENSVEITNDVKTDEDMTTVSANDPKKEENVGAVSGNDPAAYQYHLVEEDVESVAKWLSLYCPNDFEDLLKQDDIWWNNLYDYEREYAEFLLGFIMDLSENVYDEQDLSECIKILENGVEADAFFKGTVFQGLTLKDLRAIHDAGGTLEDLAVKTPRLKSRARSYTVEEEAGKEEVIEEWVAKVGMTATGYTRTGHGTIYRIMLGGVPAICISCGKRCRSSFLYHADPGTYGRKTGSLGYFAQNANKSGAEYVACQIAAWLFIENGNLDEVNVKSRAQAMLNITSKASLDKMLANIWNFYSGAKNYNGLYYEYHSDSENAQVLIVGVEAGSELHASAARPVNPGDSENPAEPEIVTLSQTAEATYSIEIKKSDWQTGIGLESCEVEIFENGTHLTTVITDKNGHAEYEVQKTAEFSVDYDNVTVTEEEAWDFLEQQAAEFMATPYTYSVREVKAPGGYVWAANEKSIEITGERTAEFSLTNERTLGSVELIKYDVESESGRAQGDATLDGAVYGIYAAKNIYHQDKKTGILFGKDQLVQTAVTGKTPKRNAEGYILNTDGSRHIAESGKQIAYENTPGKTLFGDLELGSYYVKEITPSDGYMLDETVYPVTFTYKDQMVKIESRSETAGQADNDLTADDNSVSHVIYSGDYVNKQGIQFVKTSDNIWQTELEPIAGAGFSIYLISNLSGIKNGQVTPMGESWTADDIMTFYDYDFTEEKRASVYKRTDHEMWMNGDKLWLEACAQSNKYEVKEMFTDEDGYITVPELPYGTYVVVETSTPEHYTSAKPFIVSITGDGGVLYTDGTKKTIETTYDKKDNIRYGDRKKTKEREGRILQKQRIVNNRITKTHLRILKVDEEFKAVAGTYIGAEEFVRGTVLKEGAEYRLKCTTISLSRESLSALNWKFDGGGYLSFYDQNTRELLGTEEHPFVTKFLKKNGLIQDCYIMLPQEIPVGTYELEEVTAPKGYVVNGSEQFVLDSSTDRINKYEIIDTPFPKVVFTINNGAVFPDGQMGTNKYALADEYGNLTVTVLQENQEQKGIVEITKHGEQLSGVHGDLVFEYEDAPVEGAVFAIIAAEDIYTQEVQRDLFDSYQSMKEQYLIYKTGEVAATITTDRNGWGYAPDLYIGKYKIKEITAGDGFVLNTTETEFEITGHEQTLNFDIYAADYKNERQKLEIMVEKQEQETGIPLTGAVYGLYAKEDIMTNIEKEEDTGKWVVRDVPEVLCPADTLVAACTTDKIGKGVFDIDLPLGNYYVRELEAPAGYLAAAEDISVDGSYDSIKGGQNTEKQEHCLTLKDRKTQAFVTKLALADSKEVAGATLEIGEIETDKAGNPKKDAGGNYIAKPVTSWVSKEEEIHWFYRDDWGYLMEIERENALPEGRELFVKNGHLITGLQLERAYLLSERIAPKEYTCAEDIVFKLVQEKEEDMLTGTVGLYILENNVWQRAEEDILVMYDDKEALNIEKSTISMTQYGDIYKYSVDELKNESVKSLEQFTMTDHLPTGIYLTELWTGTYNENLLYDAEYMTNKSEDWVRWKSGLSTEQNHHLQIPASLRTGEEHIIKFRLCFGTVGGLFGKVESPAYMTYVSSEAEDVILNEIELTAECNGKKLQDRDKTRTVLYLRGISGYRAKGGGNPLYEIVETPMEKETAETSFVSRTVEKVIEQAPGAKQNLVELEDEDVPLGLYRRGGVRTGDNAPVLLLVQAAVTALTGAVILWCFGRKRKKKK